MMGAWWHPVALGAYVSGWRRSGHRPTQWRWPRRHRVSWRSSTSCAPRWPSWTRRGRRTIACATSLKRRGYGQQRLRALRRTLRRGLFADVGLGRGLAAKLCAGQAGHAPKRAQRAAARARRLACAARRTAHQDSEPKEAVRTDAPHDPMPPPIPAFLPAFWRTSVSSIRVF